MREAWYLHAARTSKYTNVRLYISVSHRVRACPRQAEAALREMREAAEAAAFRRSSDDGDGDGGVTAAVAAPPDVVTYGTVLQACAMSGYGQRALELFGKSATHTLSCQWQRKQGSPMLGVCFVDVYADGQRAVTCCRHAPCDADGCVFLFGTAGQMEAAGVVPDSVVCRAAIVAPVLALY
jgi:hypothetical protein